MKIFAITFHGAHNFGSALQSYALQTFTEKIFRENGMECQYKILNYRTQNQKDFYAALPKCQNAKSVLKSLMRLPFYREYKEKTKSFESFISEKLNVTPETNDVGDLKSLAEEADCIISGSDQIWNVRAKDFDDVYYLGFTQKPRKISYAASFGPLNIDWSKYNSEKYMNWLSEYDAVSVREDGSAKNVEFLTGTKPKIHIDPTLLLDMDEWKKTEDTKLVPSGDYILMYCLEPVPTQLQAVKKLSKFLNMPVVITKYCNKYDYFNGFVKRYGTGPQDFLGLVDNAKFVVTSSFHGTAFSIIYKKPFFAIDAEKDNRISTLLKITGLESRSVSSPNISDKFKSAYDISFENAGLALKNERERSRRYLWENLKLPKE